MTEQIKSAIEVVNKYLTWSVMSRNSVSEEQIELEKSLIFLRDYVEKTSKAWEEVLQELEKHRRNGTNIIGLNDAIEIINRNFHVVE